ncbi:MAG: 2OG-Fe(II) oxygenase [Pseudomonadota bacterium]|nr:2OG-Fe(II) oxygenase [Pseudomonadota bacterium]
MTTSSFFQSVTLPIEMEDGLRLDPAEARSLGSLLNDDYTKADPFPHIVLDDFLPAALAQQVLSRFPTGVRASDGVFNIGYGGEHKRQILPEDCDRYARELFQFFNSRPILQFLEGLTGIDGLLPDPYFMGGGFHEISRGGRLGVHADFRINSQLHLQRRLNMLIYLNPEWNDEWAGCLELWSRDMKRCVEKVAPLLNRCVVFNTEADTWHGHPDPLNIPEDKTRKSIALYYYSASQGIYNEVPARSTMYVARPNDSAENKAAAREFRFEEYLKEWVPPVAYRGIQRARRVWGRLAR